MDSNRITGRPEVVSCASVPLSDTTIGQVRLDRETDFQ
jgi:hypothetical protein